VRIKYKGGGSLLGGWLLLQRAYQLGYLLVGIL
jgi:hypothetical protein